MMHPPYSTKLYTPMYRGQRQHRGKHQCFALVPNRIFVGELRNDIGCTELIQIFSPYGRIRMVNIVTNAQGVSKGYGFVTFETADDAKKVQALKKIVLIGNRRLIIASAFRKYCKRHISQSSSAVEHVAQTRSGAQYTAQTRSAVNSIGLYNMPVLLYTGQGRNASTSASTTAGQFRMSNLPTSVSMFLSSAATRSTTPSYSYPINLLYSKSLVEYIPPMQIALPVLSNPLIITAADIGGFGFESLRLILQALFLDLLTLV